jgi:uncharacterized membrane protein YbhN (UPF0104 family)
VKLLTRFAISILLTAAFLFLFLRSFDLGAAWSSLRGASIAWSVLSVALNLSAYLVRAWRWRHLLAPIRERIGFYNLTSTTLIGFMVSFLVPFRMGEIVRPILLARRERLSSSAALATIALERLLDAMTVLGLFLVFSLSAHGSALMAAPTGDGGVSQASALLRRGGMAAAAFVVIGLPIVVLLVAFPGQVVAWLHRVNRGGQAGRVARAIGVLERFLKGLGAIRRWRELLASASLSVAMWLVIDLSVYATLRAFDQSLGFFDTFLLLVPMTVGISVPTPGGVGSFEFLCQIALTDFWGVERAAAAAVAITLHAIAILPPIVIGLVLMWRDGVRPGEVRRIAAARKPAAIPDEAAAREEA